MVKRAIFYIDWRQEDAADFMEMSWRRLAGERLAASLFYDGSVACAAEFRKELLRPGCLPFAVFQNGDLAALSWLNGINGRMARTHFVIFRDFWGRQNHIGIGKHLYRYILGCRDGGGHLFDCLCGVTPHTNRLAIRAALACGWRKIGALPRACFLTDRGESVDGVLTCATREILGMNEDETVEAAWEE